MKTRKIPKESKSVTKLVPKEDQEQIMFANWLRKNEILFTASANGGSRHWLEAIKLKRMGVSKGFPDIFIPIPNDNFHGLFIEMKRKKGGVVSDEQKEWISRLTSNGYQTFIAWGCDEAIACVKKYLGLPQTEVFLNDFKIAMEKVINKYKPALEQLVSK